MVLMLGVISASAFQDECHAVYVTGVLGVRIVILKQSRSR